MSKVKDAQIDYTGIGKLLRSAEMAACVEKFAHEITRRAGDGYKYSMHNTGQRQAANIYPASLEAWRSNRKNNTLLKALK